MDEDDFDDFGDLDESALAETLEEEEVQRNVVSNPWSSFSNNGSKSSVVSSGKATASSSSFRPTVQQQSSFTASSNIAHAERPSFNSVSNRNYAPLNKAAGQPVRKGVITADDFEDFDDWSEDMVLAFDDNQLSPRRTPSASGSTLGPQHRPVTSAPAQPIRPQQQRQLQGQGLGPGHSPQPTKLFPIFGGAKPQPAGQGMTTNARSNSSTSGSGSNQAKSLQRSVLDNPWKQGNSTLQNQGTLLLQRQLSNSSRSDGNSNFKDQNRQMLNSVHTRSDSSMSLQSNKLIPSPQPFQPPTHHTIDMEAVKTWQYPINYPRRDYQYNIIRHALFTNTLASLPTGLGKTFIATVVMLNYYRWFPRSKIIFMAPTRPLVAQQIHACFKVCGIPQDVTVELTGAQPAEARHELWREKRLIFCTPQVMQNDLGTGVCPADDIVCLVIDEAHRATGRYAYAEVIRLLEPINTSIRILALTATPGGTVQAVQNVIQNLKIARIELRTEDSLDLARYCFKRKVTDVSISCGREIREIGEKFVKMTRPFLEKLAQSGLAHSTHPGQLTRFGLLQSRLQYNARNPQYSAYKSMLMKYVHIAMGFVHAYELLMVHGIRPFFTCMDPQSATQPSSSLKSNSASGQGSGTRGARRGGRGGRGGGGRGSKRKDANGDGMDDDLGGMEDKEEVKPTMAIQALMTDPEFTKMMNEIRIKMRRPDFVSHPKIDHLVGIVVQHFLDHEDKANALKRDRAFERQHRAARSASDAGTDESDDGLDQGAEEEEELLHQTRVMIFANYRDSVEEITRVLDKHRPLIKVQSFVGQASAKGKKGISQKDQQKVIADFQKGEHNVLVATSIGEEGLDIGDVDVIVCYDSHSSPIRMLQRMGRTGRKRQGKIFLLLAEGQEDQKYRKAVNSYKAVQKEISSGQKIQFYPFSPRIIPPDVTPTPDLVHIDIPDYIEGLSKGRRAKAKEKVGNPVRSGRQEGAYLDPEEHARFQQRFRIHRKDIRVVTLASVLARSQRRRRMGEQVLTIGANTTSVVGHSITTRGYLISMDRMAKSKKFLSSRQEESHGRELDAFSKRMLKHLEVPAPLSGQPFFATLRQSVESGDTSSNLFKRSSKTQKELHLAEGTSRAKRKRRGIESYLTDHLDVGLDDDRYRIHEGLDDHELDAVHRGSSGVQHALQGKRGQAESISNDSAKHLQGPAVANQGEDGTTRNDHTSLAMDISDDDIDMEIMGGLKGMIKEGTPADRRVGRDPVALEDNEADFFGAPSSPGFDDSIFEYDMAMDMDSDSGGAWQVERDGDGQGTDWDAVGGRKESECAGQDVEGFDFGASQRLVRGRRGWYTSDQSSESEDEAEERDYGKDETSMLMVLPPVPRAIFVMEEVTLWLKGKNVEFVSTEDENEATFTTSTMVIKVSTYGSSSYYVKVEQIPKAKVKGFFEEHYAYSGKIASKLDDSKLVAFLLNPAY